MDFEILSKAYHRIILEELKRFNVDREDNLPIYRVAAPGPLLAQDEVINAIKQCQECDAYANDIFKQLLESGYLLSLDDKYRTLHVDVLVRSAELRTYRQGPRYLLSSLVTYDIAGIPSDNDRVEVKLGSGNSSVNLLYIAAWRFFGDEKLARDYIGILGEYVKGLDHYQLLVLSRMLESDGNVKVHVITGPTGIGKTYIFFSFVLARIMRAIARRIKSRAILIYPRKILAADQAERLLKLLRISNDHGYKITMALRDGDTPHNWNIVERYFGNGARKPFRGIKCPYPNCDGELEYAQDKVKCGKCGRRLDFVVPYRHQMGETLVDIMITNIQTLEKRLMDPNPQDINVRHVLEADVIVMDESHEYIGIEGASVRELLKTIEELKRAEHKNNETPITYILSSATIPSPKEFASKLIPVKDINVYDFHDLYESQLRPKNISFLGERLALMAIYQMNPRFSWNTYCQLWAILMAFIAYSRKKPPVQSILFVNNVKELRRIRTGFEENINLGEPKDHVINCDPVNDAYCYPHYSDQDMLNNIIKVLSPNGGKLEKLNDYVKVVHSETEPKEKSEIVRRIRSGESLVLLATSSLELGVDYPNVTFILSGGYEEPRVLIQRIGRGGRSPQGSLRTILGIILLRSIPHETMALHDPELADKLRVFTKPPKGSLPVAIGNPAVEGKYMLVKAVSKRALRGEDTYVSGNGITSYDDLKILLEEFKEAIKIKVKGDRI